MKKTSAIKVLKILLGIYQAIIAVFSLFVVFLTIYYFFRPSPNVTYHWFKLFLLLLLLAPAIIFCSCNAVKLLFPAHNIFAKWKSLTQISIVFTVLWTLLFAYLLVFQTGSGHCQTPVAKTRPRATPNVSPLQIRQIAPDFSVKDQFGKTILLSELRGKVVLLDFLGGVVWAIP